MHVSSLRAATLIPDVRRARSTAAPLTITARLRVSYVIIGKLHMIQTGACYIATTYNSALASLCHAHHLSIGIIKEYGKRETETETENGGINGTIQILPPY